MVARCALPNDNGFDSHYVGGNLSILNDLRSTLSDIERVVSATENAQLNADFAEVRRAFLDVCDQCSSIQDQSRRLSDDARHSVLDAAALMIELNSANDALEIESAERKLAEQRLEQLGAETEQRIRDRTESLLRSNKQLQVELDKREKAEQSLRHDALHDPLTALPNRNLLTQRLTQFIDRSLRNPSYIFAVLFLDLDNFKLINDTHGHGVGDELLLAMADRLRTCLRSFDAVGRGTIDTTARLGGDEFIILLDELRDAGDVVIITERIIRCLAEPYHVEGHMIYVGTSVGIAVSDVNCRSADQLISQADTAMYRAKQAGKGRYAIFNESMHRAAMRRLVLENDLRAAVARHQLRIQYQPIVSLDDGEIRGFEALLRWERSGVGVVDPADFLAIAEESGLIVEFGKWVMEQACGQLREWTDLRDGQPPLSININISSRQLAETDFVDHAIATIQNIRIEPACVNFEFTEDALIGASESILAKLACLKEFGVRLQLDDFGSGYSSLSGLHRLPLDVVKVDRSIVGHMTYDRQYTAIIHAIISLAKNLGLRVSAEGLETDDQLAQAIALDCDLGQGFLFAKPLDPTEATQLIKSNAPWCNLYNRIRRDQGPTDQSSGHAPDAVTE